MQLVSQSEIKGSLSSSGMNSPIPSLLLPLWQNESVRTISMKIYATCTVIRMSDFQVKRFAQALVLQMAAQMVEGKSA